MTKPSVPFLDLTGPHRALRDEMLSVVRTAFETNQFVGGSMVQAFEREFADFCDSRFCVGVNSGTDALRFVLSAAGVKPGDTVLTVPFTFIATAEAISQVGAEPDFIDVDERTYTLDPEKLRTYLERHCVLDPTTGHVTSQRTGRPVTAVVPVHLYGQIADMDPILELAERYGLVVVEDACQAHGAKYFSKRQGRWRTAGSMGHGAAFSFYPSKNLGACGEAGAITTDDAEIAQRCSRLRDHGQSAKYLHDFEGYNGRLDAIQAGILQVKLRHLATWNDQRRENACRYGELFADGRQHVTLPYEPSWSRSVYHVYVVRIADRDRAQADLADAGIGTGIHYPIPLHRLKAYERLRCAAGDFPVSERAASQVLSLPMFPELTPDQQGRVVAETLAVVSRGGKGGGG